MFFIFITRELLSGHKRLTSLNLSGPTRENLILEPLAVLHLDNQILITINTYYEDLCFMVCKFEWPFLLCDSKQIQTQGSGVCKQVFLTTVKIKYQRIRLESHVSSSRGIFLYMLNKSEIKYTNIKANTWIYRQSLVN